MRWSARWVSVDGVAIGPTPVCWDGMADGRELAFVLSVHAVARHRFVPITRVDHAAGRQYGRTTCTAQLHEPNRACPPRGKGGKRARFVTMLATTRIRAAVFALEADGRVGCCMKFLMALVVGVTAAGCGGSNQERHDDAAVVGDAPVPVRTVTGALNQTRITASGDMTVPVDLSHAPIEVLVPPSFTSISGSGHADGTFSIAAVPEGAYYLVLGSRYLVLTADTVDLSFPVLGRPGVGHAAAPTNLIFDVTALAAWQSADELQIVSPSTGTMAYAIESGTSAGAPTVGATSLSGLTFDLANADNPTLVDGAAGDQLVLAHLSTHTDGTRTFRSTTETFTPASFTITNGGTATLDGAFSPLPATMFNALWDRPAFQSELAAHAPGSAIANYSTFAVSALPEASTRGYYAQAPDLIVYAPGYSNDSTAVTTAWTFGNPYGAWNQIAWCRYFKYRNISLPGATPTAIFARLLSYRDASTVSAQSPLEPIIGAVINPTVNGSPALGTSLISGAGVSPTVAWSAPTIGTPSRYVVTIDLLVNRSGATALQPIAQLETDDVQLVVPPGVLSSGRAYVFEIAARSVPNVDLSATPNGNSLPAGFSNITTTMVTP
jgi:hypothetical protein